MRRFQKTIAIALLLMNFSGVRVVTASNSCGTNRSHFEPARGLKTMLRSATRQQQRVRRPPRGRTSLQNSSHASYEVKGVSGAVKASAKFILPVLRVSLHTDTARVRQLYLWKLPQDLHPVQPPQLLSKK